MPSRRRSRNACHTCIGAAVVRITPTVAGPPQTRDRGMSRERNQRWRRSPRARARRRAARPLRCRPGDGEAGLDGGRRARSRVSRLSVISRLAPDDVVARSRRSSDRRRGQRDRRAAGAVEVGEAAVDAEEDVLRHVLERADRPGEVADRQQPHLLVGQRQRRPGRGLIGLGRHRFDVAVGAIERDDEVTKLLDPGVHGGLPTKARAPCPIRPVRHPLECSGARIDTCAQRKATPGPTCSVAMCVDRSSPARRYSLPRCTCVICRATATFVTARATCWPSAPASPRGGW